LLSSERLVEEVIDFGDAQVFEEATNYSCILILDREGADQLAFRRVSGDWPAVERVLTDVDALPAEHFDARPLGSDPWVLLGGDELDVYTAAGSAAARLDEVTAGIFTGLQTSADPIYIVEDRGRRGTNRVVYSRASGRELELEPDLLHPLASGTDVERYAFRPLRSLLLFPYRLSNGEMHLLGAGALDRLPLTSAYLREHEEALRGRERGKMDHERWYAFGRTQSLGAHDRPKLGVAATVQHLEVAADPDGGVYFHNVRVNGVLLSPDGASIWTLLVLLNSRLLDYVFRRGASEHAHGHYAANKQFIAPLPIRLPDAAQARDIDELGERLHRTKAAIEQERAGFVAWLGDTVAARVHDLPGVTTLLRYEDHGVAQLVDVLRPSQRRFGVDVSGRAFRELLDRERSDSLDRLAPLVRSLEADEAAAETAVYDLYEMSSRQRALIDSEFVTPRPKVEARSPPRLG